MPTVKEQEEMLQRQLDFLRVRKQQYQLAFTNAKENPVLQDLAKFAHIGSAPYHPDKRKNDILIGRQEMYFRILDHLGLSPEELFELYSKPKTR
jgi:hypothetical protein